MSQLLHSNIIGSGKPLIILHGFLGMSDNWKTLGKKYAENGFEVHLIDQRNHGRSFHSDIFNYEALVFDLKYYLKGHQIGKTILIGHSMGGKTAMQFACNHPENITKLIVADIAPKYYPAHHDEIIKGLQSLDFETIKSRTEADKALAKHVSSFGVRQFLLKNLYWKTKGKLAFRINLPVLANNMHEVGENISALDSFEGPTLFLKGDRSEYITDNDSEIIQKHFPNAVIDTIKNAGHWLHAENPEEFLSKSLSFINS